MMKRAVSVLLSAALMLSVLTGCGKSGSVSKKNIPAEETAELVASLKAREDLSEVRQPKAGK